MLLAAVRRPGFSNTTRALPMSCLFESTAPAPMLPEQTGPVPQAAGEKSVPPGV